MFDPNEEPKQVEVPATETQAEPKDVAEVSQELPAGCVKAY